MLAAPETAVCPCDCHNVSEYLQGYRRLCDDCCPPEFYARELREGEHDCGNPGCPHRWQHHCERCPACGYCECEHTCSCYSPGYGGLGEKGPCFR